jgi:hypothetical protein
MTLEQGPELNRLIDPSIALGWQYRWGLMKLLLPVLFFSWLLVVESALLKAWLVNKLHGDILAMLVGSGAGMFLAILVALEIQIRIRQRSKRVIQIEEKRIVVKPARNQIVPWKRVRKFQFEPVPDVPGLMKLKLFLNGRPNQKSTERAFWVMVLEKTSAMRELTGFLQKKKTEGPTDFELEILERPAVPETSTPFVFLGMTIFMAGWYLMVHGLPILFAILGGGHHASDERSRLSPEEIARLKHFILNHFSSPEEFRHFFLALSIGLTVAGVALMVSGRWLAKRKVANEPGAAAGSGSGS